jgi:hypothetical protein
MPTKRKGVKRDPISRGWKFITMYGNEQLLRKGNWQFFFDPRKKKVTYLHRINTKFAAN